MVRADAEENLLANVSASDFYPPATGNSAGSNIVSNETTPIGTVLTDGVTNDINNKWYVSMPQNFADPRPHVIYTFDGLMELNTLVFYTGSSSAPETAPETLNGKEIRISYKASTGEEFVEAPISKFSAAAGSGNARQMLTVEFNRITAKEIKITIATGYIFRILEIEAYNRDREDVSAIFDYNLLYGLDALDFYPPATGDATGSNVVNNQKTPIGTVLTDGIKNTPVGDYQNRWYVVSPQNFDNPKPYVTYSFEEPVVLNTLVFYAGRNDAAAATPERLNGSEIWISYKESSDGDFIDVSASNVTEFINSYVENGQTRYRNPVQELTVEFNRIVAKEIKVTFATKNSFRILEMEAFNCDREDNPGIVYDYDTDKNVLFGLSDAKITISNGECNVKTALVDGWRESAHGTADSKWFDMSPTVSDYVEFMLDTEVTVGRAVVCSGYNDNSTPPDILDSFAVAYYDGEQWIRVEDSVVTDNDQKIAEVNFPPVKSSRFRLLTPTANRFRVREIQLEPPLVTFEESDIFEAEIYDVSPCNISVTIAGDVNVVSRVAFEINGVEVHSVTPSGETYSYTFDIPHIGNYDVRVTLYDRAGKVVNYISGSFKAIDLSGSFKDFLKNSDETKDIDYFKKLVESFDVVFPDDKLFDGASDELLKFLLENYLDKDEYGNSVDDFLKLYEDAKAALLPSMFGSASTTSDILNLLSKLYGESDLYMQDFENLSNVARERVLNAILEQITVDMAEDPALFQALFKKILALERYNNTYAPNLVEVFERYDSVCEISLESIPSRYINDVLFELKNMTIEDYADIPAAIDKAYQNVLAAQPPKGSGGGGSSGSSGSNLNQTFTSDESIYQIAPNATVEKVDEFLDIGDFEWAKEAIYMLRDRGVVTGKGDGRFDGNANITRAEFVRMIVLAFGFYDESAACSFDDVPKDSWFYGDVSSAFRLGLISGKDENIFGPNDGITREEMATIMFRVFILQDVDVAPDAEYIEYTDAGNISEYAAQAVETLTAYHIMNGMGENLFIPAANATRAEAAVVVARMINFMEEYLR